jgi:hypothetical protein
VFLLLGPKHWQLGDCDGQSEGEVDRKQGCGACLVGQEESAESKAEIGEKDGNQGKTVRRRRQQVLDPVILAASVQVRGVVG